MRAVQNNDMIRVVVDSNIWISYLIGHQLGNLLDVLEREDVETITTPLLVEEVLLVAKRPKFSKYFSEEEIKLLSAWFETTTSVELTTIQSRCRDPKDDYLLELAIQAHAIYLVSGDKDLLEIGNIEGCQIMTVAQFIKEITAK